MDSGQRPRALLSKVRSALARNGVTGKTLIKTPRKKKAPQPRQKAIPPEALAHELICELRVRDVHIEEIRTS